MLALCKVRDASSQTSERLNFLMQCAEKEDKNGRGKKEKEKNPTAKPNGKSLWHQILFLRSASVQGVSVTFAVRSSLLSSSSS